MTVVVLRQFKKTVRLQQTFVEMEAQEKQITTRETKKCKKYTADAFFKWGPIQTLAYKEPHFLQRKVWHAGSEYRAFWQLFYPQSLCSV